MDRLERCPACRARLAGADVCTRCGVDFSISRRAERQACRLARVAVRELFLGRIKQAAAAAATATLLGRPPLARAVSRTILRRENSGAGTLADRPDDSISEEIQQVGAGETAGTGCLSSLQPESGPPCDVDQRGVSFVP